MLVIMLSFSGLVVPSSLGLTVEEKWEKGPIINDSSLKAEVLVDGLKNPTSMTFLGPDDILVLEKNNGNVKRIVNGEILDKPLLDVEVQPKGHGGMLEIAIAKQANDNGFNDKQKNRCRQEYQVCFLYYTESSGRDGNDDCPNIVTCKEGNDPQGNRLYRYLLDDRDKLVNPKLLLDMPATPGSEHVGGVIKIGADNNLYLITGDGHHCGVVSADSL